MGSMFQGASSFNQDISIWDVSNVVIMISMFDEAENFNQDITQWNVASLVHMSKMFFGASSFNQDISSWDVSNVIDMSATFQGAVSFNQDISSWDVSNVLIMTSMFDEALSLSEENKCAIHTSFSSNDTWIYDWSNFCALTNVDDLILPQNFVLHQNYPNPFNPTTQIRYDLPKNSYVSITIYDLMGKRIKSLFSIKQDAGYKSVHWNATNDLGHSVSAGMYIYTIQAGEFRQTRKMVLLK